MQSNALVGAVLPVFETVGKIKRNQAEMSLGAASVFEKNQVLVMPGSGFQLQTAGATVLSRMTIGILTGEAF